ncbi:hypothetical protein GGS23DRAFT_237162 [Durotheca rogersii]|uniref:uncharacterized protein n=1 Tax=Durotheca rogersii TaxID=419775 RepID=UPI00221EB031|nr:uncharacterized protein GGS23DRAFT_237162 [Durotheca rogersii]KAI5860439.1 hypothetical protein GGS23DRAFT_237162 [Durotheca rogersii]
MDRMVCWSRSTRNRSPGSTAPYYVLGARYLSLNRIGAASLRTCVADTRRWYISGSHILGSPEGFAPLRPGLLSVVLAGVHAQGANGSTFESSTANCRRRPEGLLAACSASCDAELRWCCISYSREKRGVVFFFLLLLLFGEAVSVSNRRQGGKMTNEERHFPSSARDADILPNEPTRLAYYD